MPKPWKPSLPAVSANVKLDAVIQASPLAIFALDKHGRVTTWNLMAERMFGWTGDEALGRVFYLGDGHIFGLGEDRAAPDLARRQSIRTLNEEIRRTAATLLSGRPVSGACSLERWVDRRAARLQQPPVMPVPAGGAGQEARARAIVLEAWQTELVASAPWAFLRGCIRSDGCVVRVEPDRKRTKYLLVRLLPTSREDIRQLFVEMRARVWTLACRAAGEPTCESTRERAWRGCWSTSASSPELPAAR